MFISSFLRTMNAYSRRWCVFISLCFPYQMFFIVDFSAQSSQHALRRYTRILKLYIFVMNISVIFLTLPVATITQIYAQQISDYQIVTKAEDI